MQEETDRSSSSVLEDTSGFKEDETEDSILHLGARLYRYDVESKEWEKRGDGFVDLLKHKDSGKVRLLMRRSPSFSTIANHPITATTRLEEYAGEINSCMWNAPDYQHGEVKNQLFRIEFASSQDWDAFIRRFEDVMETQSKKDENEDTEVSSGFLEKIAVREAPSK